MKSWLDNLPQGVHNRLSECRNKRADLRTMVKAMWKWEQENATGKSKAEVVDKILEWVGDWNNQFEVADVTDVEYQELLRA